MQESVFSPLFQLHISHADFLFKSEYLIGFQSICYAAFSQHFLFSLLASIHTPNPQPFNTFSPNNYKCPELLNVKLHFTQAFWKQEKKGKKKLQCVPPEIQFEKSNLCCPKLSCTLRTVCSCLIQTPSPAYIIIALFLKILSHFSLFLLLL